MTNATFHALKDKMCMSYDLNCEGCPLKEPKQRASVMCDEYVAEHGLAAREIVKEWALGRGLLPDNEKKEKSPETRREILKDADRCVYGGRELDHGTPEQSFHAIARQWEAYLASRRLLKEGETIHAWDAATMLALFKVARISVGNFVADSYVDGCGYLACAGELAANEQGEKHEK